MNWKRSFGVLLICLGTALGGLGQSHAGIVATFEESELAAKLNGFGVYEGDDQAASQFRSGNVTFHNDGVFFGGTSWSGFGISRKTTRTGSAYWEQGDDLISQPRSGAGASATWGVVYSSGLMSADSGYRFESLQLANTRWAYDTMTLGDPFTGPPLGNGGGTGRFTGQDDFFIVRFTNPLDNRTLEFSLADFRGPGDFVRGDWTAFDVSALDAQTLNIDFLASRETSYDGGNTYFTDLPVYAAIDNVSVRAVPEPGAGSCVALVLGLWAVRRRGRSKMTVNHGSSKRC